MNKLPRRLMQARCSLVLLEVCAPIGAEGLNKVSRRKPLSKCSPLQIALPSSTTTMMVSSPHLCNHSTMAGPVSQLSVGPTGVETVGKEAIAGREAWEGERVEKAAMLVDTVTRRQRDPAGKLLCQKQRWCLVYEGPPTPARNCWRLRRAPSWKSSLDSLTWPRPSFASLNSTIHKPSRASLRICSTPWWNVPVVTALQLVD